jgi:hypothetical protein
MPPNCQLYCLNRSPWCRSDRAHGVIVFGAISGATLYRPSLPPCTVGYMLQSISGRFQVGSWLLVNAYSTTSVYKGGMVQAHKAKGGTSTKPGGRLGVQGR